MVPKHCTNLGRWHNWPPLGSAGADMQSSQCRKWGPHMLLHSSNRMFQYVSLFHPIYIYIYMYIYIYCIYSIYIYIVSRLCTLHESNLTIEISPFLDFCLPFFSLPLDFPLLCFIAEGSHATSKSLASIGQPKLVKGR